MTCQHEDVTLVCPFGCGETVDSDTYVCSVCQEGVAPDAYCNLCEEVIMVAVPHGMSMKQVRAQVEDDRQATVLRAQLKASLYATTPTAAEVAALMRRADLAFKHYNPSSKNIADHTAVAEIQVAMRGMADALERVAKLEMNCAH